ncbi:unnamed protein product [Schistosoma margrebowiei]|uniref:Uncharacterized protein n=1 Tax=Schistosoma margrebowiei TaxID=48269 RepID=A0A183LAT2_9TREM|nr:unnamed protein product [Schistosoma margrebowiei]
MVAGDQRLVHTPFVPSGYCSPCAPLVWNQGFLTPLDGLSMSNNPVKAPDVRFSSSQFRKQHRPFGVALLFAGVDERGPQLYHMDPSGTYIRYEAKAIGSGSEGAQQALQEIYHKNMTLHEGCKHALSILKQVMEEKLDSTNVEMATVSIKDNYHLFNKDEVQRIIEEINQPSS